MAASLFSPQCVKEPVAVFRTRSVSRRLPVTTNASRRQRCSTRPEPRRRKTRWTHSLMTLNTRWSCAMRPTNKWNKPRRRWMNSSWNYIKKKQPSNVWVSDVNHSGAKSGIFLVNILTHWPLGDLDAILKLQFSISFYWLVSSHRLRIMPWDECQGTSSMISQHWYR